MIFPSFQIKFKLQTNFKSVFTGQRQFHTVDPSFSTNRFQNCHFWSKSSCSDGKTTSFWKFFKVFFRSCPILTEKNYFGSSEESSRSQNIVLIKIDLFSQEKWLNMKRSVMSFLKKNSLFEFISGAILDRKWSFLIEINLFLREKWFNFKRSVMSFFEMEHFLTKIVYFDSSCLVQESVLCHIK